MGAGGDSSGGVLMRCAARVRAAPRDPRLTELGLTTYFLGVVVLTCGLGALGGHGRPASSWRAWPLVLQRANPRARARAHAAARRPHLERHPLARGVVDGDRGRQLLVELDCGGESEQQGLSTRPRALLRALGRPAPPIAATTHI